jgi:hypothetical protein
VTTARRSHFERSPTSFMSSQVAPGVYWIACGARSTTQPNTIYAYSSADCDPSSSRRASPRTFAPNAALGTASSDQRPRVRPRTGAARLERRSAGAAAGASTPHHLAHDAYAPLRRHALRRGYHQHRCALPSHPGFKRARVARPMTKCHAAPGPDRHTRRNESLVRSERRACFYYNSNWRPSAAGSQRSGCHDLRRCREQREMTMALPQPCPHGCPGVHLNA